MKAILINYNFTPTWLLNSDFDYHIYDRSDSKEWLKDFPQERITYEENLGQVDYPKLRYLIDHYDDLPEVFLWGKTNLFKYITEEEFSKVKDNQFFTPLLTQNHKTYSDNLGPVCYYSQGIYHERNNGSQHPSWYTMQLSSRYFRSFHEFAFEVGIASPYNIPFAPGANYILTKDTVHKYSRDFYEKMASYLPYCRDPAEAHIMERAYYLMWK